MEHRLAHLVELDREERAEERPLLRDLVEDAEDALLLHEAAPAIHDLVRAPRALEVARVRDLDEQVVDRVEAARHLAQIGQRRHGGEGVEVGWRHEVRAHAGDQELLAELEAERGAEVLRARRIEVRQREHRPAEPTEPGRLRLPALLGHLVDAVPRRAPVRRSVLHAGTRRSARRSTRPPPRSAPPPCGATPGAGRSRGSTRTPPDAGTPGPGPWSSPTRRRGPTAPRARPTGPRSSPRPRRRRGREAAGRGRGRSGRGWRSTGRLPGAGEGEADGATAGAITSTVGRTAGAP